MAAGVLLGASACGPGGSDDGAAKPSEAAPSSHSATASSSAPAPTPSQKSVKPSPTATGAQPAPHTTAGAIQRYEVFLHAVGREDIDTVCEVAGPAAKQAEDQGFGPCTSTFVQTFRMIPPAKKKALQTATVNPQRVTVSSPDKVEIPSQAVVASTTFTDEEVGSSTLEYVDNNWFITD
jgi:hypothetical protein